MKKILNQFVGEWVNTNKFCKTKRIAFTLAEVLITLGIIGVIAALTLPALIQNYKKQETVTRLQKAISVLNNGMRKMMADEEVNQFEDLRLYTCKPSTMSEGEVQQCLQPYFKKYFNIVNDNVGVAVTDTTFYPYTEMKFLDGRTNSTLGKYGIMQRYAFITGDGILYVPFSTIFLRPNNALIDVNGKGKPNQLGKDIFILERKNDTYIPESENRDDSSENWSYCDPQATSSLGYSCAGRIMEEGWKINY